MVERLSEDARADLMAELPGWEVLDGRDAIRKERLDSQR